jgi:hypothetical protein
MSTYSAIYPYGPSVPAYPSLTETPAFLALGGADAWRTPSSAADPLVGLAPLGPLLPKTTPPHVVRNPPFPNQPQLAHAQAHHVPV